MRLMSLEVNASPKQQLKQCTEYIYLILNILYALQSSHEKKKRHLFGNFLLVLTTFTSVIYVQTIRKAKVLH